MRALERPRRAQERERRVARVAGADGEPLGCVTVLEGADTLADATKAAKALVKALNKERKAAAARRGRGALRAPLAVWC